MHPVTTDIQTITRDDIMTVCRLLSEALKPHINQGISILITGMEEGGKSALVDGLTAACMDNGPSSLPKYLVEDEPDQADYGIKKLFKINAHFTPVTFDKHAPTWLKNSLDNKGLNFLTDIRFDQCKLDDAIDKHADIIIDFRKVDHSIPFEKLMDNWDSVVDGTFNCSKEISWLRDWKISINNPDLQTPEMDAALKILKHIYAVKQEPDEHLSLESHL